MCVIDGCTDRRDQTAVGCQQGRGHDERTRERGSAVEGEPAGAVLGELGEELADRTGLLEAGEVEEAVHLVVADVGEQGLAGGARVERAAGVGARDERQVG